MSTPASSDSFSRNVICHGLLQLSGKACGPRSLLSNVRGLETRRRFFFLFPKQDSRFLGDRGPLGPRANGQVPPFEIEILD